MTNSEIGNGSTNRATFSSHPAAAHQHSGLSRADEVDDLYTAVKDLIVPFVRAADQDAATKSHIYESNGSDHAPRTALIDHQPPNKLTSLLELQLGEDGAGREGFLKAVQSVLQYSVNTWDQGFLDKLYAAPTPVGVAADMLLSALNTNLHVYQVSPALTVIEKQTARALANKFGFKGPNAGGGAPRI